MSLAADTALSRDGDGRFRGEVSEAWWIERGPFGGYLSAFLVRAMLEELDDPQRPPRSLTVHFVDAPAAGPIEVAVQRRARGPLEHRAEPAARAGGAADRARARRRRRVARRRAASGRTCSRPRRRRRRTARRSAASRARRASRSASTCAGSRAASRAPGRARPPRLLDAPEGGRPARPPGGDRDVRRLAAGGVLQARALRDRPDVRPDDPLPRAAARAGRVAAGGVPLGVLGRRRVGGGRRAVGAGRHAGRPVAPARDDAGAPR